MIGLMDGGCSTFCRGPFKLNLKHAVTTFTICNHTTWSAYTTGIL